MKKNPRTKVKIRFGLELVNTKMWGWSSTIVPNTRVGRCLRPEGNGVSSRGEGEGGPGPPNKEGDKQSIPSEAGDNMEQEATWSGRKKERRVRHDEEEPACTE